MDQSREELLKAKQFLQQEDELRAKEKQKTKKLLLVSGIAYVAMSTIVCFFVSLILPILAIPAALFYIALLPFGYKMATVELHGLEDDIAYVKKKYGTLDTIEKKLQQITKQEEKEKKIEPIVPVEETIHEKELPKRLTLNIR